VRWAVPGSPEAGYQTTKCEQMWDEVRFPELNQSTKHSLKVYISNELTHLDHSRPNHSKNAWALEKLKGLTYFNRRLIILPPACMYMHAYVCTMLALSWNKGISNGSTHLETKSWLFWSVCIGPRI
jgi:hypothetical protein